MSATTLSDAVRERLRTYREGRRWTQERLADEVAKLGVQMYATAITRIEKGTRKVSLEELAALARALNVPPVLIMFPLGDEPSINLFPEGEQVSTWSAVKWWTGEEVSAEQEGADAAAEVLPVFREHDQLLRDCWFARVARERGNEPIEHTKRVEYVDQSLANLRRTMRRVRLLPPDLPSWIASAGIDQQTDVIADADDGREGWSP